MSFHADANTRITCHTYGAATPPILALDGPSYHLTISSFDKVPLAHQIAVARALATETAAYLEAVQAYITANSVVTQAG